MAQISTTKCDLCERDTGKLFCYECRHFLCPSCKNIHDKIQKKHTVTDSHNVDRLALSTQLTCGEHKEDFVHFCSSCECLICSSCVTTVHRGHSLTPISAVVSKARKNVKLNIVKLKTKMKTLTALIEPIKATKFKEIKDDSEHFSSEVTTTSEHIISIVNSVKEIHITRASDFLVSEKQQLEFTIAKIEKVYNEHASVSSQLEQVLQLKHDVAFFLNQRTITKQIGDLDDIPRIEELNEIGKFNKEEFAESVVEQTKSQYNKGQENTNTNLERQLISAIHKQIGCERTGDENITLLTDINKEIQKSIKTLCEKSGHDIEASQIAPKGADKITKRQASATPMPSDLRTAVDSTECIMKANHDVLTYRKELKEISDQVKNMVELQGFQPDIRKGYKDTLGAEVKETLVQIQQRNRQENKENDVAKLISEIHEQIGCRHSEAARGGVSLLEEIKGEIQTITHDLREYSCQCIEANTKPAKQPEKKSDKKPSVPSSSRPTTVTLRTLVKNMESTLMKTSWDLTTSRGILREIQEQVLNMYTVLGLQPDTKRDNLNADIKGMIRQVEQRNTELSENLKWLDNTVISSHGGIEQRQDKDPREKLKKDKKGSINEFALSSAVARISELQEYKRELSENLKWLDNTVISSHGGLEQQQHKRPREKLKKHKKGSINEFASDISTISSAIARIRELQEYKRELSENLKWLDNTVISSHGGMEQQQDKGPREKMKKDKKGSINEFSSDISTISSAIARISELQEYKRELSENLKWLDTTMIPSHGGLEQQQHKRPREKLKKDKKGSINEFASYISTISSAVARISELQEYKRKMDCLALRVIHLGKQKENRQNERTVYVALSHFEEAIDDIEAYISTLKRQQNHSYS